MTRSTKAAVIGLLVVLIVAAVALVWYILQPQTLIDTDTLSVVRDGSTITVHDLVADEVYTFRIVRVRRSENHRQNRRKGLQCAPCWSWLNPRESRENLIKLDIFPYMEI